MLKQYAYFQSLYGYEIIAMATCSVCGAAPGEKCKTRYEITHKTREKRAFAIKRENDEKARNAGVTKDA